MCEDDGDDEFYTATDDEDSENGSDACTSMPSDDSVTMGSDSEKTVLMSTKTARYGYQTRKLPCSRTTCVSSK